MIKNFSKLVFSTAGIPLTTKPRNIIEGIKQVSNLGLQGMELEFVHGITVKSYETASKIKKTAKEFNITLSCHGPYYINLNAQEDKKKYSTYNFIKNSAIMAAKSGAFSVCYHAAFLMKQSSEKVTKIVIERLGEIVQQIKDSGEKIWIRPETAGKLSQWGTIEQIIEVSNALDKVLPCIDFSHLYAYSLGKNNSYDYFYSVLETLEKSLGKKILSNMHIHLQGIEYGDKGEEKHLPLKETNFKYKEVLKALKEFNCKGVVVCESPVMEEDALQLQKLYNKL